MIQPAQRSYASAGPGLIQLFTRCGTLARTFASSVIDFALPCSMLALYRQLFTGLHENQVDYGIWKNRQEIPDALAGIGDIDLYIAPGSRDRFISLLHLHDFVRLISHKGTPGVDHYYGYDAQSGNFCHLHCYFRMVTGESHIKQFVVPVESYLAELPCRQNEYGVRELHPLLQYKLNLFRRAIKLSCLPGALLFFRERRGYEQERLQLDQARRDCADADTASGESGWLAAIQARTSFAHEILAGLRYRIRFSHWSRFSTLTTPIHRYVSILRRAHGKLQSKRKMLPAGLTVAITGTHTPDAHRLEDQLDDWLGTHFEVVRVFCPVSHYPAAPADHNDRNTVSTPNLPVACGWLWRSFLRHLRIRKTLRRRMGGSLVLWCGHDANGIRHLAASLPWTAQSTVTTSLLRMSATLLRTEPAIDILLHLPEIPEPGSSDSGTRLPAADTRQAEPRTSTNPSSYPMQVIAGSSWDTAAALWKRELWHTLSALQN
jgi:hypothetical protein